MDNQKKISLVEAILMILFSLTFDAIDALFSLIALTGIGAGVLLILPFIDGAFFAIIEFWLIMRGGFGFRKQVTIIVGNILDMVPFLNALPLKTVSTAIAISMINKPEIGNAASLAKGKMSLKAAAVAE